MWDLGLGGRVILEQQDGILGCGRKQGTRMNMDRGPVVVMQSPPCSGVPGNWGLTCWGLENLPVPTSPNPHPLLSAPGPDCALSPPLYVAATCVYASMPQTLWVSWPKLCWSL